MAAASESADRRGLRRQPRQLRLQDPAAVSRPRARPRPDQRALRQGNGVRRVEGRRHVHGLPRNPREEGYRHRRRHRARSLAHDHDGPRGRGREGHLLPEAADADHGRGSEDDRGGAEARPDPADRQPVAFESADAEVLRNGPQRRRGEDPAYRDAGRREQLLRPRPGLEAGSRARGLRLRCVARPGAQGPVPPRTESSWSA